MTKRVVILAGAYAGQILKLSDAQAALAITDLWARDVLDHDPSDAAEGEPAPLPESLIAFETALATIVPVTGAPTSDTIEPVPPDPPPEDGASRSGRRRKSERDED